MTRNTEDPREERSMWERCSLYSLAIKFDFDMNFGVSFEF